MKFLGGFTFVCFPPKYPSPRAKVNMILIIPLAPMQFSFLSKEYSWRFRLWKVSPSSEMDYITHSRSHSTCSGLKPPTGVKRCCFSLHHCKHTCVEGSDGWNSIQCSRIYSLSYDYTMDQLICVLFTGKNKHICCRASNIILITFSLVQWSSNFCATAPNK